MECSRCGYVMQEYEKECPRCSRMGAKQPAAPGRPQPAAAGGVAVAPPRYLSRPDEDDYDDAPALGWPLTVMLWTVLMMSIGELLFFVIGLYIVTGSIIAVGFIMALGFFGPVLKVAGIISLLREQRWGLFVYAFTCVVPAILNLMMPPQAGMGGGGGTLGFLILLVVDILPAIVIFYLAMTKWEILE
ncbi:MAG: hypothetical protein ACYDCO_26905 [Armatimonadota bacterium]